MSAFADNQLEVVTCSLLTPRDLMCRLGKPILANSRHELFAQQIAGGTCSGAEAYRRAGGRTKNANVIASRWLRKVSI
jgi:phage terminase small subunit